MKYTRILTFTLLLLAGSSWMTLQAMTMPQEIPITPAPITPVIDKTVDITANLQAEKDKKTAVSLEPLVSSRVSRQSEIDALRRQDQAGNPKRFAQDLFDVQEPMIAPTEGGISEDYLLGVGDEFSLNVFGSATFEVENVKVDGKGELSIPKIGVLKVAGLSLGEVKKRLTRLVNTQFSRATVSIQVVKLREVRIMILGDVYRPGGYLVPSLSSIVNVLSLSGGPTMAGSYRDIRIIRNGVVIHRLDLYPLRAEGLGNINVALQSGDTIFVPLAYPVVLLQGVFVRVSTDVSNNKFISDLKATQDDEAYKPGWLRNYETNSKLPALSFELKDKEALSDMIQWAGGVDPYFGTNLVTHQYKNLEGNWDAQTITLDRISKQVLAPGDIVTALPQTYREIQGVRILGAVRITGPIELVPNMKVADLIKKYNLILPQTYLPRGEVTHLDIYGKKQVEYFDVSKAMEGDPKHNLKLLPRDTIRFDSLLSRRWIYSVNLNGPLPGAGRYDLVPGMRAADLIFKGGLVNPERINLYQAELGRVDDLVSRKVSIIPLNLTLLLSTEETSPVDLKDNLVNPVLQPNDTISLYINPKAPSGLQKMVRIVGQIERPGSYVLDNTTRTLDQLIQRAGGFTENAMPQAAVFMRGFQTTNQGSAVGLYGLGGVDEILRRLVTTTRDAKTGQLLSDPVRLGSGSASAKRLVVDFVKASKPSGEGPKVVLEDGDEIVIPERTSSVYILGEVSSPFAAYNLGNYDGTMTIAEAIKRSGGFTVNAFKSQIRLLKADGRIIDSRSGTMLWTYFTKMEAGDTLLVPPTYPRVSTWQEDFVAITPLALFLNAIK